MLTLFHFFTKKKSSNNNNGSSVNQSCQLYNSLLEDENAIERLSSDTIAKLTNTPFYDFKQDDFLPPVEGKARSAGSLLAYLCRYNVSVGLFVLKDKELYRLLHDNDILLLSDTEAGEKLKTQITDQHLEELIDPRFKQYLYQKVMPCLIPG